MDESFEGGCQCGGTRYRMTRPPMFVHACHCGECRRLTGSAFALNALVESDRIETLAGAPEPAPVIGTSGKPQTILRCPRCRVALWSHYPRLGRLGLGLRVGTLDDPGAWQPDAVIFTESKMPWVALPEGIPTFETVYNAFELLPAERVTRLTDDESAYEADDDPSREVGLDLRYPLSSELTLDLTDLDHLAQVEWAAVPDLRLGQHRHQGT